MSKRLAVLLRLPYRIYGQNQSPIEYGRGKLKEKKK